MNTQITAFIDSLLGDGLKEPGPPHSIQLEIDTEGDIHGLFEVLLLIMTGILKRWYALPITIGAISQIDTIKLVGFYASFGIQFNLDIDKAPKTLRVNNRDYLHKSRLDDMNFQMVHDGKLYTVYFSKLPTT